MPMPNASVAKIKTIVLFLKPVYSSNLYPLIINSNYLYAHIKKNTKKLTKKGRCIDFISAIKNKKIKQKNKCEIFSSK